MKGLVYSRSGPANEVVTLCDTLVKPPCGPNDVLLHVHAVGINPADCKIIGGLLDFLPSMMRTPPSEGTY